MTQLHIAWICLMVAAVSSHGDGFAPVINVSGAELAIRGQGVLRYKRIIPVYDAALYLPAETKSDQALGKVMRRLVVVYRVGTQAQRFADAGDIVLAKNFSAEHIRGIQARLDQINALFPNPEKGDHCAITYVPEKGTELSFNGESLGWIEGDDFAEAYFTIWLGDKPASVPLRDDLLNPETVR